MGDGLVVTTNYAGSQPNERNQIRGVYHTHILHSSKNTYPTSTSAYPANR